MSSVLCCARCKAYAATDDAIIEFALLFINNNCKVTKQKVLVVFSTFDHENIMCNGMSNELTALEEESKDERDNVQEWDEENEIKLEVDQDTTMRASCLIQVFIKNYNSIF